MVFMLLRSSVSSWRPTVMTVVAVAAVTFMCSSLASLCEHETDAAEDATEDDKENNSDDASNSPLSCAFFSSPASLIYCASIWALSSVALKVRSVRTGDDNDSRVVVPTVVRAAIWRSWRPWRTPAAPARTTTAPTSFGIDEVWHGRHSKHCGNEEKREDLGDAHYE